MSETDQVEDQEDSELREREERLDHELRLIGKMRVAMASSLHMFEAARDSLVELGDRMDRLQAASELCRKALAEKKVREQAERVRVDESKTLRRDTPEN